MIAMMWADSTNSMTTGTATSVDCNRRGCESLSYVSNQFVVVYQRTYTREDAWERENERFDAEWQILRVHYEAVGKSRELAVSRRRYRPSSPAPRPAIQPVAVARKGLPAQAPMPVKTFSRAAKRRGRAKLQRFRNRRAHQRFLERTAP